MMLPISDLLGIPAGPFCPASSNARSISPRSYPPCSSDGSKERTYRRSYDLYHSRSAWSKLGDEEFLRRIGAAGEGGDGELHPTKAGLLMFGEEWRIQPKFPNYFLDYRQETSPETRWQDRVTSQTAGEWSGNVFDFFQRAYEKMRQALKVPFKLDGNGRRVDETPAHAPFAKR